MLRILVVIALCLTLSTSGAFAQLAKLDGGDLDRAATLSRVSEEIAIINAGFAQRYMQAGNDPDELQRLLMDSMRVVMDLRDFLASNPFLRLSSFNVGLPTGVTVEFTFPPADE